jgi:exodeoxyribonuclease-3
MRLISWNINSLRLRLPLLKRLVEETAPDIICLQETKVQDGDFPHSAIADLGFPYVDFRGEKSYNGVAILSKIPFQKQDPLPHGGKGDMRHMAILLPDGTELHNLYVPAGGDIPDLAENPKFAHKLCYLKELTEWSHRIKQKNTPTILVGDLNIAPLEHDVWSHKQLIGVVSHTPVEVETLTQLYQSADWIDAHRHFVPATEKLYSWWSYRNRDWQASNRGRRLDHIWLTPHLLPRLEKSFILQEARNWPSPSDHVPIIADFKADFEQ